MTVELKPCPFCGGKARFSHFDVVCIDCGVTAYGNECAAETAKAWNTRASDATISRLTEEVERLRAALVEAGNAAGALISPNASADALVNVPEQVLRLVASLRARSKAAEAEVEGLRSALAKEEARATEAGAEAALWHEASTKLVDDNENAHAAIARHIARAEAAEARVKELECAIADKTAHEEGSEGGDNLSISQAEATRFLEMACRNWRVVPCINSTELDDVAQALSWFLTNRFRTGYILR